MAISPSHKFGQDLGNLLEYVVLNLILKPRLEAFTDKNKFFLDSQSARPTRPGKKKVTWKDHYGNSHDLDFVIEVGGSPEKLGRPVAFIEAAWRRYTKHSKNKVQEIQGAILPIIEMHKLSAPFFGAVLAGDFSAPSLAQLRNNNFNVLYIPYQKVVDAFLAAGLDIEFDEGTADKKFASASKKLNSLTVANKNIIRNELISKSEKEIEAFMDVLQKTLDRVILQVTLMPMFGTEVKLASVAEALKRLAELDLTVAAGKFRKIEVIVDYNNGDTIRASFGTAPNLNDFLCSLVG